MTAGTSFATNFNHKRPKLSLALDEASLISPFFIFLLVYAHWPL